MLEVIAGALVAAAAIGFVLEPLYRPPHGPREAHEGTGFPNAVARSRAEAMVRDAMQRFLPACPQCAEMPEQPVLFCPRCGSVLLRG
jgi:hypothetical protein